LFMFSIWLIASSNEKFNHILLLEILKFEYKLCVYKGNMFHVTISFNIFFPLQLVRLSSISLYSYPKTSIIKLICHAI
jgi:hypothetical protein